MPVHTTITVTPGKTSKNGDKYGTLFAAVESGARHEVSYSVSATQPLLQSSHNHHDNTTTYRSRTAQSSHPTNHGGELQPRSTAMPLPYSKDTQRSRELFSADTAGPVAGAQRTGTQEPAGQHRGQADYGFSTHHSYVVLPPQLFASWPASQGATANTSALPNSTQFSRTGSGEYGTHTTFQPAYLPIPPILPTTQPGGPPERKAGFAPKSQSQQAPLPLSSKTSRRNETRVPSAPVYQSESAYTLARRTSDHSDGRPIFDITFLRSGRGVDWRADSAADIKPERLRADNVLANMKADHAFNVRRPFILSLSGIEAGERPPAIVNIPHNVTIDISHPYSATKLRAGWKSIDGGDGIRWIDPRAKARAGRLSSQTKGVRRSPPPAPGGTIRPANTTRGSRAREVPANDTRSSWPNGGIDDWIEGVETARAPSGNPYSPSVPTGARSGLRDEQTRS